MSTGGLNKPPNLTPPPQPTPPLQVPSFDSKVAMDLINQELGQPFTEVYSELRWACFLPCNRKSYDGVRV